MRIVFCKHSETTYQNGRISLHNGLIEKKKRHSAFHSPLSMLAYCKVIKYLTRDGLGTRLWNTCILVPGPQLPVVPLGLERGKNLPDVAFLCVYCCLALAL